MINHWTADDFWGIHCIVLTHSWLLLKPEFDCVSGMNVSFHTLLLLKEIAFQCERLLHCSSPSGVWLPPASDTARKAAAPVVLDQDDELICGLSVAKLFVSRLVICETDSELFLGETVWSLCAEGPQQVSSDTRRLHSWKNNSWTQVWKVHKP